MRLIDADALKNIIATNVYPLADYFNSRDYGMFWTGGIEKAIDEQPTIDAVEVIRCKDCKYYSKRNGHHYCYNHNGIGSGDAFCSYAERRTDAN